MPLASFLNGSVPLQLRGAAWLALSDLGQVGAGTVVDDGGGGGTSTWNYGGTIPCRTDPLAGDERIVASKLSDRSTHLITVPPGTSIDTTDRFKVIGGDTFEVTAVRLRTAEPLTFFEAVQVS